MKPVRNVFSHFEHLGKQLRGLAVKLADQCCPREQKKSPHSLGHCISNTSLNLAETTRPENIADNGCRCLSRPPN